MNMKLFSILLLALVAGSSSLIGEEGVDPKHQQEIIIKVDSEGSYVVEGEPLKLDAIAVRLQKVVEVQQNVAIRIDGHVDAKYGDVVRVVDACQDVGITNISFSFHKGGGDI
jgi:biopolymer transport protein ExbD